MSQSVNVAAIVGSLRAESFSRLTFRAAGKLLSPGVTLTEVPISEVALFNQDVEATGFPAAVVDLQQAVRDADAVIFFTPEYNRSIPAVTKNAVDWLSRPYGNGAITNVATGIVATVPGQHQGEGVRAHLTDTLSVLTEFVFDPSLAVNSVGHRITNGELTDAEALEALSAWLGDFTKYVRDVPTPEK